MRKYFGTDGIRRIANSELTPELVYKVAKAGAYVLSKHSDHVPTIFIGRDTRISGTLIEAAMTAGFLSYGANVKQLGVIPTPGVAYLTKRYKADASVVISASHNTYEFNGIKYFSNKGMKIPDDLEEEIEEIMESGKLEELTAVNEKIGVAENREDLLEEYVYFFRKNFEEDLENMNKENFVVAVDTANGATSAVADKVFTKLGINHIIINNNPNGINNYDNLFLRINYRGDVARVYADGRLVADNFWNGKEMWVRMADLVGKKVELKILPLRKDAPVYFQKEQKAMIEATKGDYMLGLDSVEVIERHTLEFNDAF